MRAEGFKVLGKKKMVAINDKLFQEGHNHSF